VAEDESMTEPPDMRGAALDIARSDVDLSLCFLAIFDQGMIVLGQYNDR
jgi:hypothetical protein